MTRTLALWSLIIIDVWNTTAFVALIVLAGLQGIPEEPRQAARVDGASSWQIFRLITLPLLRPVLLVAVIWRTIDLFRIFDVVFSLTGGGPYNATETISLYAYNEGFASFNLGFASAISYLSSSASSSSWPSRSACSGAARDRDDEALALGHVRWCTALMARRSWRFHVPASSGCS